MKKFVYRKYSLSAFILALEVLLFAPAIVSSVLLVGCSHPTDYITVHDTDTIYHHDTIPGPAFIRFLALLNNPSTASGTVHLKLGSPQNPDPFADVAPEMRKQFIPIPPDTALLIYATYFYGTGSQKVDSLTIPKRKPFSMATIVLFRTNDAGDPNRLFPIFADDSTRKLTPPKDSCYIRLINGLPDFPQPTPAVNLHIDDINAPAIFLDPITGLPTPVNFQEIRNYVLIPAGLHKVFVRSESDASQYYSATQQFTSGQFYTIRLIGSKIDGTDQLSIDAE
ncbi:MAG: hypothetical protein Q8916_09895 [Bacteroidota bacterium]|nr:hypothetical protein [Bacteroidota bacterium]MDP4230699.1 hypothetical protein [Bacteroidota bacterium]MDP4236964.1 hypothetical protein [Bacteroidota bacterium]